MIAPLPDWIEAQLPPGVRRQLVDVDDQRMHVMEWGPADGRTVLLLHGNPTWSFLWRKVVAAIRARPGGEALRLVAPDLVGLGLSSKPRGALHSLEHHAAWLGVLIDQIVRGPLVIAAQDWGGPIGLAAMRNRRTRLRGLVLGNTSVSPPHPSFKPSLFHRLARMVPNDVERHPSIPTFRDTDALLRALDVPMHFVWGTRDPILGRVINHLARLRPDATVTRTQAGHFLQEEVPEPLADAVLDVVGRASWT